MPSAGGRANNRLLFALVNLKLVQGVVAKSGMNCGTSISYTKACLMVTILVVNCDVLVVSAISLRPFSAAFTLPWAGGVANNTLVFALVNLKLVQGVAAKS